MSLRAVDQLAFDEQLIEDTRLEAALEERQRRKDSLSAVRLAYDEACDAANFEIEKLELPVGAAARVGRFRITRTHVPGRSVSFESKATTRVKIALADDD
jgi:hypothetical protein